ncbi:MAG TPA: adenylate/guanylate cyclase domain-containing protein, partial [Gaiellales bacterium]|nr:adenylate/guanylate cyclase domain-containing protein [Gaiellales bacterium]
MAICPGCGEENPDRFRLCGFCGTPLAAVAASREVRKTVTIVFSDLKGSTSLGEALDSESLREVMNRYFDEMRRAIERHGGTVEKFIGDAVMAVFGLPIVHEDDALRAVRAAWDMRTALADLNSELERRWGITLANRTGVNTGEVVANDAAGGQRLVTGDTVNVAARLEQAAPELEILIGESTHRLVRAVVDAVPVEPLVLKGKSAPVAAHLLRGVRSGAMLAGRPDAPLVGREQELAALRRAFDDVTGGRGPRLVTLLAQPGVGKSRLLREFLDGCGEETTVLRGTCLSYGEGITFWPLAEAIRGWVGISEGFTAHEAAAQLERLPCDGRVRERIGSMMGVTPADFSLDEI